MASFVLKNTGNLVTNILVNDNKFVLSRKTQNLNPFKDLEIIICITDFTFPELTGTLCLFISQVRLL